MVPIPVEGSSQSPGDQAHTVRKAPGLSAGVTVTYHAQYLSQQQRRFLSYGFFFFFKIHKEVRDVTRTRPPASSAHKHLTVPPPKAMLLASSSSTALWDSHRLPGWGHYARSRMTPLSEPSRRWHFVGSTARLVSVPLKFSELSLVVLVGRAEDSSME